jgi:hypothetical protein
MHILSSEHLAELLVGIARAQATVVQALEMSNRVVPALQAQAETNLVGLPVRLLLASLGRTRADAGSVAEELERLCALPGRPTDFNP